MLKALHLQPSRDRQIVKLAGPIVGGMLSQTVVNLVDTAMVGRLSADALAAVGLGSIATWLSVSLLLGVGSATQALVARRIGEQRPREAGRVLNNALALGGASGLVMGGCIYLLTPVIFSVLAPSPEVERLGVDYLTMRTIGFPFVVMNFAFRGFYHGIGDTRTYLKAIVVTHLLNVVLDLLLIFGLLGFPRMEVKGAGLATALGLLGGNLYYFLWATRCTRVRERFGAMRAGDLCRETCRSLLSIQIPNGLQGLATALGFMTFFWMMARIDTLAVAISNVMMNISSLFHLPAYGMGLAAATLVGQSLGRREPDEAEAWGWETVRLATYALVVGGLALVLLPGPMIRIFTDEATVIDGGRLVLQILGAFQFATAFAMVLSNILISAGNARWVMGVTIITTYLLVLPSTYIFCVLLGGGVTLAWVLQGGGRLISGLAMTCKFRAGGWKSIEL
jgi:putative MATE family efflux protein